MLRLALKNLWAYKRRLLTSALSIVLGISFLSGSFVFTDTLKGLFTDLFTSTTQGVDGYVRSVKGMEQDQTENGPYSDGRAALPVGLVETIRTVPGVAAAEGSINGYAQMINKKGKLVKTGGAPTFGYPWLNDAELISPYKILNGRAPSAPNEIAIDRSLVKTTGYKVGDTAKVNTLEGSKEFTIVGDVTFGSSDSSLGATSIFFEPSTAQDLLGNAGQVQGILVRADEGITQEDLNERLKKALRESRAVNGQPVEAITETALEKENISFVNQIFGFINTFFNAFAVVALFVSIFVISNSFSIVVAQRTREMAMLRVLGARRRQVLLSTFLESLAVGLVASLVGVFAGLGTAWGIRQLINSFGGSLPSAGLVMKPRTVIVGMIVGTLVTVLASILPAWRASRVKPLAALREVSLDRAAGNRTRQAVGILFAVASAGFLVAGLQNWDLGKWKLIFFTLEMKGATTIGVAAGLALLAVTLLGPALARPIAGALGKTWFGYVTVVFGAIVSLAGAGFFFLWLTKRPAAAVIGLLVAGGVTYLDVKDRMPVGRAVFLFRALGLVGMLAGGLLLAVAGVYLVLTGLSSRRTEGRIARENSIRNPTRTSATALALTIGTALVSGLLVLSQSLTGTFRGALSTSVKADYVVASAADIGFPEEVKAKLEATPGVTATSGLRFARIRFGFPARTRTIGAIDGENFDKLVDLGDVEGSFADLTKPDTIAIDKKSAKTNNYKIGGTIKPTFPNGSKPTFTIVALYDNAEGLGNTYYLTGINTLKAYEPSEADDFLYVASDGKDRTAFEKAAETALADYPAAELKTKKKFADQQIGQFNQFLAIVNALLLLAIIIAILGIANTLKLSIFERTREIGLLRAVGMSRDQVRAMIRWEAIVVATLGSVLGVALGTGFGSALVKVLGRDGSLKLTLPFPMLIGITLLASLVGLYAARKPAKDAAGLNILRAIATE